LFCKEIEIAGILIPQREKIKTNLDITTVSADPSKLEFE
jgi:hypothetical protein